MENNIITTYKYGNLPMVTSPKNNTFLPTPTRTIHIGGDFCILVQYYYMGPIYEENVIDFEETSPKQLFYSKHFNTTEAFEAWKDQKLTELGESYIQFYDLNDYD
jgi:hypothetical protein